MKSLASPRFWKCYAKLPRTIRQQARKAYQLWVKNPRHPSLHFKQVDEEEPIFSVRITDAYRTLGVFEDDTMLWYWIDGHDEYIRLLNL